MSNFAHSAPGARERIAGNCLPTTLAIQSPRPFHRHHVHGYCVGNDRVPGPGVDQEVMSAESVIDDYLTV
jgi:hypothetical protein